MDVESALRNFRMRRRLGLLPKKDAEDDGCDLRWIRQRWRPVHLPESGKETVSNVIPEVAAQAAADLTIDLRREAAELQQRVEDGYGELNRERRAVGALMESLRRQGESVDAINAETARLSAQMDEVRSTIQERSALNGQLREQVGLQRESRANAQTQAVVLASAVSDLSVMSPASTGASGEQSAREECPDKVQEELTQCRAQIAAILAENAALEQSLASRR